MKVEFKDLPKLVQGATIATWISIILGAVNLFLFWIKLLIVQIGRL